MSQRSGRVGAATDVLLRAGVAAVTVAIALGLALAAQASAIPKVEFPLFLTAVAITVWNAGAVAGTLAVVLSSVAFNYFFTLPIESDTAV